MVVPISAERVVVRVPNWVGDVVHSLPALAAIRAHFVNAELTIVARGEGGALLYGCPFVDRVVNCGPKSSVRGMVQTAAALRRGDFDLGIVFTNSFEGALLFFLGGVKRRVGYATDGRRWLLSDPIDCNSMTRRLHQVDYYLSMVCQIGIRPEATTIRLALQEAERRAARDRLQNAGWSPEQLAFAFCPGAGSGAAKRWPIARFVALATRVAGALGAKVIFLGGPAERELGRIVDEQGDRRLLNFMGRTTLREAMALIDACELAVSNDSGLLHVADALGVPAVGLFGPTNPERTAHRSGSGVVLRRPVDCSPCEHHECPLDHRCMDQLSVDEVCAALLELLHERGAGERDHRDRGAFAGHN